ncbi:transcriptional regulator [Mangrovactinospora gilvigrisea]|uniref:Transcriptional regulator n=1 Tax=Mangrovactinospora gilvigrisea TaxID=1428644 RepID=A0A1J7BDV4_9ACTN|nr:metalloregulator ArsR/SmtB family transcription factor [Mangrovactinospora gilvigrisea]OIV36765.1 transcriptional regulator [Mangrovactinospora gilvigrisea]
MPDPSEAPSPRALAETAAALGLLASPARLHILWRLSVGEADVSTLAEEVGGALPAISQHLAKLKLGGLVRSRREGRRVVYLVAGPEVSALVHRLLEHFAGPAGQGGGAAAVRDNVRELGA